MTLKQHEATALNCGPETETRLSLELPHERIRSFGNPQPGVRNQKEHVSERFIPDSQRYYLFSPAKFLRN